jgi:hypothetical protein
MRKECGVTTARLLANCTHAAPIALAKMTMISFFSRGCYSRAIFLSLALLLSGCNKTEVGSYRVPKEKGPELPATAATSPASSPASPALSGPAPAGASGGSMATTPVAIAAGPGLVWNAPPDWQPKPLGAMRKGSFVVAGDAGATADLSITAFPGAVGGELANINRWRGQIALPPIDEHNLAAAVTRLNQNGLTFTVVDLFNAEATQPQRILGAMVPYERAMWFFKLSGPDALVTKTKPAFLEFIKTVQAAPAAP